MPDPLTIMALASIASTIPNFFKKRPKAPQVGMSDKAIDDIVAAEGSQIDANTQGELRSMRSALASRGLFSSGQLPALESNIRTQGILGKSKIRSQLLQQREAARQQLALAQYQQDMNDYNMASESIGAGLGSAAQILLMNKYLGKDTTGGKTNA